MEIREKLHNYVYITENTKNNKIYIGVHSTDDINDGYIGSGIMLRRAISKYGIDAFTKTILSEHATRSEAFKAENLIVNPEFLSRTDVYNLHVGGCGPSCPSEYARLSKTALDWIKK